MKKFIEPELNVESFEIEDIITTSNPDTPLDPDQGEII